MACVNKYKKNAINLLLRHNLREKKEDGSYYKHRNTNIDTSLSDQNIDFMPWRDARQHHRHRCNSVYIYGEHGKHADEIVYLAEWIVTLPSDVRTEDTANFFKYTHEFLCNRYGEENAVASNVHVDEVTPHLHFDFVPIVYDKKKKREKLCCKDVLNKKELQSFHQDLSDYLESRLGYRCSIITGERAGKEKEDRKKNLSIEELKEQTSDRVKSLSIQIEETKEQIAVLELNELEDEARRKRQEGYIRAERLDDAQRIIDVNEKNKLLELDNEQLREDNRILRNENLELIEENEKQADTLNTITDIFEVDAHVLVRDINKIVVFDENVKSAIRQAAAQLKRVVKSAYDYYQRVGYNIR